MVSLNQEYQSFRKGYTFIEVLVVLSVLGLVMIATIALFLTAGRAQVKNKTISVLKQTGNYALETIERKVHNAASMADNNDGGDCDDPGASDCIVINPDAGTTESIIKCSTSRNCLLLGDDCLTTETTNIELSGCTLEINNPDSQELQSLSVDFTLTLGEVSESFHDQIALRAY